MSRHKVYSFEELFQYRTTVGGYRQLDEGRFWATIDQYEALAHDYLTAQRASEHPLTVALKRRVAQLEVAGCEVIATAPEITPEMTFVDEGALGPKEFAARLEALKEALKEGTLDVNSK